MLGEGGGNTTSEILGMLPSLRLLARTFVRDTDAADDLLQETLVKALAGISGFTPGTDLWAWLFTIMRNTYRSNLRRDGNRTVPELDLAEAICRPAHDIGIGYAQILAAIWRMPAPYREALILVFLMEESYEAAARICRCPVGTIKSRVSRARATLMADLGAHSLAEMVASGE